MKLLKRFAEVLKRGKRQGGLIALGCAFLFASAAAQATPVATDVRVGVHSEKTRFVLELDKSVDFKLFVLADPYRVVVDLPEIGWQLPARPLPRQTGVIESFRYGLFQPGTSRLVIDLEKPADIKAAFLIPPRGSHGHRFVLDLVPTTRDAFMAKLASPKAEVAEVPTAKPNAEPRAQQVSAIPMRPAVPEPKRAKHVVVIDPGHGGVDPGAKGVSGIYEKHITLAMARALKDKLEATGRYEVHLTRNRDIFIRLRDRVALGRKMGAELFVSLHADTIRDKNIRGASIYTLSENASDKEAAELAERENKADVIAGVDLTNESSDVTNILIELAQRETMNQSARFASLAVSEMNGQVKMLRRSHRFAGFAVLKAPDVPSVLIELGFLSNQQDERALRNRKHRAKVATALQKAIDGYFAQVEQAEGS